MSRIWEIYVTDMGEWARHRNKKGSCERVAVLKRGRVFVGRPGGTLPGGKPGAVLQ